MRGERAEQQRIIQAQRDLSSIKADLAAFAAPRDADEEDEDLYGDVPTATARVSAAPVAVPAAPAQGEPPRRRRRQARLQVLSGEEAK